MIELRDLKARTSAELVSIASALRIDGASTMRSHELVIALLQASGEGAAASQGLTPPIIADGVLECLSDGYGFLRASDRGYLPGSDDIYVSPSQIRRFDLRTGDVVHGAIRAPRDGERYLALLKVERVNERPAEESRGRIPFDDLSPRHPRQRFDLEAGGCATMRLFDFVAPIGRGQRALLAGPPRSGKTHVLERLASTFARDGAIDVVYLLIGARPEDLAEASRTLGSSPIVVVGSTFDEPAARHVQLAEMIIERGKRFVERGRDSVVILDSLTTLGRAYGTVGTGRPGSLDPIAIQKLKRFFCAARSVEQGGSLTIVGAANVDGSCSADDTILDELRGAASCEWHLGDASQHRRGFPFVDLKRTATHREDVLVPSAILERLRTFRARLAPLPPADSLAILVDGMKKTHTNRDLLDRAVPTEVPDL